MAESLTLARPYARAAFEFALGANAVEKWSGMLGLLAALVEDDRVLQAVNNPSLTVDRRAEVLLQMAGEDVDASCGNLLRLLSANNRLPLLPEISLQFEELRRGIRDNAINNPVNIRLAFKVVRVGQQFYLFPGVPFRELIRSCADRASG